MEPDGHRVVTLHCLHCGRPLVVQLNCGKRTCAICRKKWFGYHYKYLLKVVRCWPVVRSLTLTVKNIDDSEFSRASIKNIRRCFSALLKKIPAIRGGFYVVQATNRGAGWHLHLHVLWTGDHVPKDAIVGTWRRITGGSYIINSKDVPDPPSAIRYLLSDFSGEPRILQEHFDAYNSIFKGQRLVQSFGECRRTRLKTPFECPDCGFSSWDLMINILNGRVVQEDSS